MTVVSTKPRLDLAHVRTALESIEDPTGIGTAAVRNGTLYVPLPSAAAAMVFAAALTSAIVISAVDAAADDPNADTISDRPHLAGISAALEIMSAARNGFDGSNEARAGIPLDSIVMVMYFPGVELTDSAPAGEANADRVQ